MQSINEVIMSPSTWSNATAILAEAGSKSSLRKPYIGRSPGILHTLEYPLPSTNESIGPKYWAESPLASAIPFMTS